MIAVAICVCTGFFYGGGGVLGYLYFPTIFSVTVFLDLMSCIPKKITGISLMIRRRLWCQLQKLNINDGVSILLSRLSATK